jgi:hypothetical protein
MDPFVRMTGQLFCNTATPERISVWMLLQCEHIITTQKDLSVQLAGTALLIAVARNEFMPTQGVLFEAGLGMSLCCAVTSDANMRARQLQMQEQNRLWMTE